MTFVPVQASTLKGHNGKGGSGISPKDTFVADTVRSHPRPGSNSNGNLVAATLSSGGHPNSNMPGLRKEDDVNIVPSGATVRRLTPEECEALQALPRGWTNPDGKVPDSRRYAGLGDAVTASVGEWIGRRIIACG